MDNLVKIKSALISVYYKDKLDVIVHTLAKRGTIFYSTGGSREFIENLGYPVIKVEDITSYPPILDGRVKTLHPKIFGGILAIRNEDHLHQLETYEIPTIDMVIVDLYPFEETVANTKNEQDIIEKIDIGGISLIRAAAKNFNDVVVIASKEDYLKVNIWLENQDGCLTLEQRKELAAKAFAISSRYDMLIYRYMASGITGSIPHFTQHISQNKKVRYGENPHQDAVFYGNLEDTFDFLGGKELSYNNLVDVDAAVLLMSEFKDNRPTFAILKHTNPCGVCTGSNIKDAYLGALACDPLSAFGGVFISNTKIDGPTALEINKLFYEVMIAPAYDEEALSILLSNSKRIILRIHNFEVQEISFKTILHGVLQQDVDLSIENPDEVKVVTKVAPSEREKRDLLFALKCVKHLKSNTIVFVKNEQLIGMGCGQTSRIDACKQAVAKADVFDFVLDGAVMASDAFFPFPDCVEVAHEAGITSVIQPGGSIKDNASVDFCDSKGMSMIVTGVRHFKH
ncbi:MAG: bifunctional phosphoribosylaminoimidazolecarboxamide formyltransferase/IMP cyclohydrolase [Saprospiraceae bacterium]|nr:bifunctional phosphoribosylaminoimidazolecarboxamide formyltransferase/IMP cyclohydrolase [Saprospiraceae bacterium]